MKTVLTSVSELPEALRGEYEEKDGKFVLKLDGDVSGLSPTADLTEANTRVKEFRDSNIGLRQQLDTLNSKFNGFDPEEHKALKEKVAAFEAQTGGDDVTVMMQKAIEKAVTPLQNKLQEQDEREKAATSKLAKKELESILTLEGLSGGIAEHAMMDYLHRGMGVFSYKEGKAVAMDGDSPMFSEKKPSEPLSPKEWVGSLSKDAPHLFKKSQGGGAPGGADGGGGNATYDPNDDADFLKNLDKIASAEMKQRE